MARPGLIANQGFEMELVKALLAAVTTREICTRFGLSRHAVERYKKTERFATLSLDYDSAQNFPAARDIARLVARNPKVPQPETIFGHDHERYRALQELRQRLEHRAGTAEGAEAFKADVVLAKVLPELNKYEDEFSKLLLDMTGSAENIRAGYIMALADHYRGQFNDTLFAEDEDA